MSSIVTGNQTYFGINVEVEMVKTFLNGLCYKLQFFEYFENRNNLMMIISSSVENLKSVQILVAANNTWQGIIGNTWPYNEEPLFVFGQFSNKYLGTFFVDLKEDVWMQQKGRTDFDECINGQYKCSSIFDSSPNKNQ